MGKFGWSACAAWGGFVAIGLFGAETVFVVLLYAVTFVSTAAAVFFGFRD